MLWSVIFSRKSTPSTLKYTAMIFSQRVPWKVSSGGHMPRRAVSLTKTISAHPIPCKHTAFWRWTSLGTAELCRLMKQCSTQTAFKLESGRTRNQCQNCFVFLQKPNESPQDYWSSTYHTQPWASMISKNQAAGRISWKRDKYPCKMAPSAFLLCSRGTPVFTASTSFPFPTGVVLVLLKTKAWNDGFLWCCHWSKPIHKADTCSYTRVCCR